MVRTARPAFILVALCLLLLHACGGDQGPDVRQIASVAVLPASVTLVSFGATQQLNATARDPSGRSVGPEVTFTWTSSAPGVASVSADGTVTAVANGSATITAAASGSAATGTATVTVAQQAASIAVTLSDGTLTAGETSQASAQVTDAGGSPVASPNLTWTSSDVGVATVSNTGLVVGVSDGKAGITASQDGVKGTDSVVVVRTDIVANADTILGGNVIVGQLSIPAGVTVTLWKDVVIDSKAGVSVAGTLVGDCFGTTIQGAGPVTVSGTIDNSCKTQVQGGATAPGLLINAPAGVDLTDAQIVSSGPITVLSEAAPPAFRAAPTAEGALLQTTPGLVDLTGTTLRASPTEAPQSESVADTPDGADMEFRGSDGLTLNGTTIRAQHGGPGASLSLTSADPLEAFGGNGGGGGDIKISIPESGKINFRTSRGATQLIPGDGGPGGPARATTTQNPNRDPAPSALAVGGSGGRGGATTMFGAATLIGDIGLIKWQVGIGGQGGFGTAIAADGVDATAARPAQVGGSATAQGGPGGNAGFVDGGFQGMPTPDPKQGGSGGVGKATGGRGGNGIRANPDGARGGSSLASGGRAGNSFNAGGRTGADAIADGGNGGNGADVCPAFTNHVLVGQISVNSDPASSDPFIFNAGSGIGLGLLLRVLDQAGGPGGAGGDGALLAAIGGSGGLGREVQAPKGTPAVGPGANGGNGGSGIPNGPGGNPGSLSTQSDQSAGQFSPVFQKGMAGTGCSSPTAPSLTVRTSGAVDQTIEITGTAPWVNVTGILATDGTVTASGRGTVAGFSNILTEFSGTWDSATQTLTGTYTIDSEKVINPGHPVVYTVSVKGG